MADSMTAQHPISRGSMTVAAFSTVVEWYDFTLYLYFSTVLSRVFFGGGAPGFAVRLEMKPLQMDPALLQFSLDMDGQVTREAPWQHVDAAGLAVSPGFIDTHLHIESSLVTPFEFDRCVLPHGVTTAICDPHEIANVLGAEGIRYFLDAESITILPLQRLRVILRKSVQYPGDRASMLASSSAERVGFLKAATFSSIWLTLLAPIKAEVMAGFWSTQIRAICASDCPRSLASALS